MWINIKSNQKNNQSIVKSNALTQNTNQERITNEMSMTVIPANAKKTQNNCCINSQLNAKKKSATSCHC